MKKYNYQYYIFGIYLICGSFSLFASNLAMNIFSSYSYVIFFTLLPILFLFILFFPKKRNVLMALSRHHLLRILLYLYLILSSFFQLFSYINVISDYYYPLTPKYVLFFLLLLCSLFIGHYGLSNIAKMGFVLFLCTLSLYSITIFSETKHDFLLLQTNMKTAIQPFYALSFIFVFLDVFLLFLLLPFEKVKKTHLFLVLLVGILISSLFIFENYLFFPEQFFDNVKYPYIFKYLSYKKAQFFEHFDLLYLICVSLYMLLHLGMQQEMARLVLLKKRKTISAFLFPIILTLLYWLLKGFNFTTQISLLFMSACSILITSFFIFYYIVERRKKA